MRSHVHGHTEPPTVLGVSFDGLSISGLIVEFLKVANIFRGKGFRIALDLGFSIRFRGRNFGRNSSEGHPYIPPWVSLVDAFDSDLLTNYTRAFLDTCQRGVVTNAETHSLEDFLADDIANLLVETFNNLNVRILIVENGTLPENPIVTNAFKVAIERYGLMAKLDKFVMWRDHDLMWSSEPLSGKYGAPPYARVPRIEPSRHTHYVVQHDHAKEMISSWCPGVPVEVIPNTFAFEDRSVSSAESTRVRSALKLEAEDVVLSRCTRIIPQKQIENDLYLFSAIKARLGDDLSLCGRRLALVVAGLLDEDPQYTNYLRRLVHVLGIEQQVMFIGGVLPFDWAKLCELPGYTVRDILAISSFHLFLTSPDYESFGNPIAEAVASRVPYASTHYDLYDAVYGRHGINGILIPKAVKTFDKDSTVVQEIAEVLVAPKRSKELTESNFRIARGGFSSNILERKLHKLFAHEFYHQESAANHLMLPYKANRDNNATI